MQKKKNKKINKFNNCYPFLLLIAMLFMSIGYASINLITMDINGNVYAKSQDGVFITNIEVINDKTINANNQGHNMSGTLFNDSITLSSNSENISDTVITYKITVYNSNDYDVKYDGAIYDSDDNSLFYTNQNIIFELKKENDIDEYIVGELLNSKSYHTFYIIFKYNNEVTPDYITQLDYNKLDFYINFEYKRFYNISYLEFDEENLPSTVSENSNLVITFNSNVLDIEVKMNNIILEKDIHYQFDNGLLNINKVNGDIVIINKSSYVLKYYANGGYFSNNLNEFVINVSYSNPQTNIISEIPTRIFHEFLGWTDEKNSDVVKYDSGQQIDASLVNELYAVWSLKSSSNSNNFYLIANDNNDITINVDTQGGRYERLFLPLDNLDPNYEYELSFDYEGSGYYHDYPHGLFGYKVINVSDKNKYSSTIDGFNTMPSNFTHFIDGGEDRVFDISQNYSSIIQPTTSTMYLFFEFADVADDSSSTHVIKNIKLTKTNVIIPRFSGGTLNNLEVLENGYKFNATSSGGHYERLGLLLNNLDIGKNYTLSFDFYSDAKFVNYTYDYYGYQITEDLERLSSTDGTDDYTWISMEKVNQIRTYSIDFTSIKDEMYLVIEYSSAKDGSSWNYELSNIIIQQKN